MCSKKVIQICFWLFASILSPSFAGECAPFYCSLDSEPAITQCGGTVNGAITFSPGVIGLGANFNGAADVSFVDDIFDTPAGSLSLWLKKNSSDPKGGIMEIGRLGMPNSMGVFYANSETCTLKSAMLPANTRLRMHRMCFHRIDTFTLS